MPVTLRVSRLLSHFYRPASSFLDIPDRREALSKCGKIEVKITRSRAWYAYAYDHGEIVKLKYHLIARVNDTRLYCRSKARESILRRTERIAKILDMDGYRILSERTLVYKRESRSYIVLDIEMHRSRPYLVDRETYVYLKMLRDAGTICDGGDLVARSFMYRLVNSGYAEIEVYPTNTCFTITSRGRKVAALIHKCNEIFESYSLNYCVLQWTPLRPFQSAALKSKSII